MQRNLRRYFSVLQEHYGTTHWWPGESPFEIAVGAILTQNTAWTNVENAIANLKRERLLTPGAIEAAPAERLEQALRPSGYFRVKARRLRSFCEFLNVRYRGSVARMAKQPLESLRAELLAVHGVGPETADDILLYACGHPVFVVDAYTRRILARHGEVKPDIGYEALRGHFEETLPAELRLYREYHALLVLTGKDFCKPKPRCESCPLACFLPAEGPIAL